MSSEVSFLRFSDLFLSPDHTELDKASVFSKPLVPVEGDDSHLTFAGRGGWFKREIRVTEEQVSEVRNRIERFFQARYPSTICHLCFKVEMRVRSGREQITLGFLGHVGVVLDSITESMPRIQLAIQHVGWFLHTSLEQEKRLAVTVVVCEEDSEDACIVADGDRVVSLSVFEFCRGIVEDTVGGVVNSRFHIAEPTGYLAMERRQALCHEYFAVVSWRFEDTLLETGHGDQPLTSEICEREWEKFPLNPPLKEGKISLMLEELLQELGRKEIRRITRQEFEKILLRRLFAHGYCVEIPPFWSDLPGRCKEVFLHGGVNEVHEVAYGVIRGYHS